MSAYHVHCLACTYCNSSLMNTHPIVVTGDVRVCIAACILMNVVVNVSFSMLFLLTGHDALAH